MADLLSNPASPLLLGERETPRQRERDSPSGSGTQLQHTLLMNLEYIIAVSFSVLILKQTSYTECESWAIMGF